MARVICEQCHMEYNAALRLCPNCATPRPGPWRRLLGWRWPFPLAIGLAIQVLSAREGPDGHHEAVQRLSDAGSISHFIAGMLVFSALAALLLLAVSSLWNAFRRRARRRQRQRIARNQPD